MKIYIIFLWIFSTSVAFALPAHKDDIIDPNFQNLSIELKIDKKKYTLGEPIYINYILKNSSSKDWVTIDYQRLSHAASLFFIKSPNGQFLESMDRTGRQLKLPNGVPIILPPNSFYGISFNLFNAYPESHPFNYPHNFDTPGLYQLTGIYNYGLDDEDGTLPEKQISSTFLTIQIVLPSAEEIKQIEQDIRGGSEVEKIRAVELMRKAKLKELLDSIAPFLTVNVSANLKRAVAQAFYEMPDIKYYSLYIKHLKSPQSDIRGFMALILGEKLKLKEAVPALIEVADPAQYPQSYRSVLRALIEIGDTRAIPAIRKIAETETSDVIKKYAQDNLKILEAKEAAATVQ